MDLADLALNLRADAERLTQGVLAAERETVADLLETADRWSSGGLTPADLRELDHPFATRHGAPPLDPGEINDQTGTFRGNWVGGEPVLTGGDVHSGLYNTDPKAAAYLQPGTRSMFARPVDERIAAEVEPRREQRIEQALGALF